MLERLRNIGNKHFSYNGHSRLQYENPHPECDFLVAKTGEEAVSLVCNRPPDIVLMDIRLPQMSGIEATRRIKTILPQAEVVMLIPDEVSEYKKAAEAAGASACIVKDQLSTELIPVVTRLLSQLADTSFKG